MPKIVKLSKEKRNQPIAKDLIKFDKFPINHYDNTLILLMIFDG